MPQAGKHENSGGGVCIDGWRMVRGDEIVLFLEENVRIHGFLNFCTSLGRLSSSRAFIR